MHDSEEARILALRGLDILDTAPEERFDRIARLAMDLFHAPISLVSLVDQHRQWFKSHPGIEVRETPRSWAFCDHAIRGEPGSILVVEDAAQDDRFRDNPLVTGDPKIRFYAGAVISDPSGAHLGTLCVIDDQPRLKPSAADLARLRILADLIERELRLTKDLRQAEEHRKLLDLAEQTSGVAHWRYDFRTRRFTASSLAYEIHGVEADAFDGTFEAALDLYDPRHREEISSLLRQAQETGRGFEFQGRICRPDGQVRTVQVKTACQRGPDDEVTSLVGVFQDVSDAVAVRQRAQDSERLARLLAENASDVVTFVAPDGRLTFLSSSCERITGYRPEEMIGRTATKFIFKEDWLKVADAFQRTMNGEVGHRVEYRLIRKDGQIVWIEARPTLFRDPDTHMIIGVTDAMRDVTDRRRAEAELAATSGRYRTLFEALATGVVVQDQSGAIIEANHSATQVLGLSREELLGRKSVDPRWKAERSDGTPFHGEEHPAMVTLKSGRPVRQTPMRVTTPGGAVRWIEVSADPLFEQGPDRPSHVVCTFQDVTDVRQAQRRLAERERRFARILQALPMPVYTTDTGGYLTFWNDAAAVMWGIEPELGRARWSGAVELMDADGRPMAHQDSPMAQAINTRERVRGAQGFVVRPDGGRVPFMAFPTAIFDDTGSLTGGVNVLVDITDHQDAAARQRRLIEELERSKVDMAAALQAAEAANQSKSAFLANMSHELRTPLNGVMGVAGALYLADIAPQHREMAKLISDSAQTLEDILSDILDWSKVEAGKLAIEALDFSPEQSLSPVIELMRLRALDKSLSFELAFDGPVGTMVVGDPLRIKQVVANLLSNAVKFTQSGGISVRVAVVDHPHDIAVQMLSIAVEDTGIGFGEEVRERLFDRFEQADASFTRRYGGTGLGLPIALGLVRLMGGHIDVVSAAGVGSRFTVILPLRISQISQGAESTAPVDALALPIRVLLAEDHPTNQKVVTMILEPLGASVTVVDDGIKALDAFMTDRFDLIIMDMQMPEMDGLTAIGRIREIEQSQGRARTPVAVLSANASDEHRAGAARAGADVHIAKPVTPHSLIAGIMSAIEASEHPELDMPERTTRTTG